jgi:glutathione gamma-glutamylcysteinyltransferase
MDSTLYRRPLPAGTIAFSSPEGRAIFAEALAHGGLEGYFPLAEQFHTQADPAFCGLGSLVMALNALAIDPGRLWKGPWRWFAEDLLDCCVPLEQVRARGLDLDELSCLARCNGAAVETTRAAPASDNLDAFRADLLRAARAESVLIAAYDRAALGHTGSGHFSPLGGIHAARDLVLVLDVARFKYPPHWVSTEQLWRAMQPIDAATGHPRGWLTLRGRGQGIALGYSIRCAGESWQGLARRFAAVASELARAPDLAALARASAPLVEHIELRTPQAPAHQQALEHARAVLREHPVYAAAVEAIGGERAETVTLLLLVMAELLEPEQRALLGAPAAVGLAEELESLRAQLAAVANIRSAGVPAAEPGPAP